MTRVALDNPSQNLAFSVHLRVNTSELDPDNPTDLAREGEDRTVSATSRLSEVKHGQPMVATNG